MAAKILLGNRKTGEQRRFFSVDAREALASRKGQEKSPWFVVPASGDQREVRAPIQLPPAKVRGEPLAAATELANAGGVDPLADATAVAEGGGTPLADNVVATGASEAAEGMAALQDRETPIGFNAPVGDPGARAEDAAQGPIGEGSGVAGDAAGGLNDPIESPDGGPE